MLPHQAMYSTTAQRARGLGGPEPGTDELAQAQYRRAHALPAPRRSHYADQPMHILAGHDGQQPPGSAAMEITVPLHVACRFRTRTTDSTKRSPCSADAMSTDSRQRRLRGTHKGHQCQEGVRTWPGDFARRRAGLTILLDPSSQVPGSSRRAARGQAGAPAAAQRRGRTSLTPASGGRSSGGGEGFGCGWLTGVVCWFPVRGWRSGLASTHPAPRQRAGGCHDHVSGTGLLSQKIERGAGAGSCRVASVPGAW